MEQSLKDIYSLVTSLCMYNEETDSISIQYENEVKITLALDTSESDDFYKFTITAGSLEEIVESLKKEYYEDLRKIPNIYTKGETK